MVSIIVLVESNEMHALFYFDLNISDLDKALLISAHLHIRNLK